MDNFAEYLVKRQMSNGEKSKLMAVAFGGGLITALIATVSVLKLGDGSLFSFAGLLLAAAAGYGTFYYVQSQQVEYEYTFTNGTLDIAKIIAKKRRKEILSVDVKDFTAFGKYDQNMDSTEEMTEVLVSENLASGEYYADFTHETFGSTRLIFSPSESILENIRPFLRGQARQQFQKEN